MAFKPTCDVRNIHVSFKYISQWWSNIPDISSKGVSSVLMFSVLGPVFRSPGSTSGWGHLLCSWARHLTLTVPLLTHSPEYEWVPANCSGSLTNFGEITCDGLAFRPGGLEILPTASCYRKQDTALKASLLI